MKIGILGGTFDPIHIGHLSIGFAAMLQYQLDQVWFMPAGNPYFKDGSKVTERHMRLEMTRTTVNAFNQDPKIRAALAEHQTFCCSDFEMTDPKHTYTAETLRRLKELHPEDAFYFILGLDSLKALHSWYEPALLFANASILCARRIDEEDEDGIYPSLYELCDPKRILQPADPEASAVFYAIRSQLAELIPESAGRIGLIHAPIIQLSSSYLRAAMRNGETKTGLILPATLEFIQTHSLYRNV